MITYTGYTTNLEKRLRQHNGELKGGAKFTRNKGVWKYFYVAEFNNKTDAMSCEWKVKHSGKYGINKKDIMDKIIKDNNYVCSIKIENQ